MWVIVFRGANIRVSHGRDEKQNVNAYNNQVVYISMYRFYDEDIAVIWSCHTITCLRNIHIAYGNHELMSTRRHTPLNALNIRHQE